MFANIENLKALNIYKGIHKPPAKVTDRKRSVFVFGTSGAVRYKFDGYHLDIRTGEVLFIPRGSTYTIAALSDAVCKFCAVSFDADVTDAKPAVYPFENFSRYEELCFSMPEHFKFCNQSELFKCYSLFYEFLSYISNIDNTNYADKKKLFLITPAVRYIQSHIYDADLKTDDLHLLCGISGTYFRKIFLSNFGTNPKDYISKKRLSHAKTILDSGNFYTIGEVASSVGYTDPLYFSRAFKKKYGISPSECNE